MFDVIKISNWHCFYLQTCWIKFFSRMINIRWLRLICSSLSSISTSLLLKKTNSFARSWHWFRSWQMLKFNEFYSTSINQLRRKLSLLLCMTMNTIWNISFFWMIKMKQAKFSYKISSWTSFALKKSSYSSWFRLTSRLFCWLMIQLRMLVSKKI